MTQFAHRRPRIRHLETNAAKSEKPDLPRLAADVRCAEIAGGHLAQFSAHARRLKLSNFLANSVINDHIPEASHASSVQRRS